MEPDFLEAWFEEPAERVAVARIVAESIRRAHRQAPASWALTVRSDYARLNVGQVAVLELYPDLLALYGMSTSTRETTGRQRQHNWPGYRAVAGSHERWMIAPRAVDQLPRSLMGAHADLVDAALTAKRHTSHKKAHTWDGVIAVSQASGIALEQPSHAKPVPEADRYEPEDMWGDAETNRIVERAAVDLVTRQLAADGWTVQSREADRCGYDLACVRRSQERHVEVKGRSGPDLAFALTSREMEVAESDPVLHLAVVTEALTDAKVHWFSAREFLAQFSVTPVQYVARRLGAS